MKTRFLVVLATLTSLLISGPVLAQVRFTQPNWDRGMAFEVIENADPQGLLARLFRLAREGDSAALIDALSGIVEDRDLPDPVTDYVLFTFTVGLDDLEAGVVSPEVLRYLSAYWPRTLVPHEESADVGVPLFNVRAAVAGLRNAWERQRAGDEAVSLDGASPETWIDRFLAASPIGRRGFLDAMADVSPRRLHALGEAAAARLPDHPELTLPVALAGAWSDDLDLVWRAIREGSVDDLPAVFRTIAEELDVLDCVKLLLRSLGLDSNARKALAIALLGPLSLDQEKAQDALFGTLASPELGAGAALVLSASSNPRVQERLNDLARTQDSLAGQRARLAVNLRQDEAEAVQ
jgi:hypothetical protein